jgi:hypothetical protein
VFVPHRIYRSLTLANLPLLLVADLAYLFLGYMLFRAGLKRYESGNLVVTRV